MGRLPSRTPSPSRSRPRPAWPRASRWAGPGTLAGRCSLTTSYPGGLDSYLTAVDGVTIVDAADRNNVQAAILAIEKNSTPVVNIIGFGGKPDGSTDNTSALTAAMAALPTTGGTVYFPASANPYVFASAWNLSGKNKIRFRGAGPARNGGSFTASVIKFTT